jgi:hypothetical protein
LYILNITSICKGFGINILLLFKILPDITSSRTTRREGTVDEHEGLGVYSLGKGRFSGAIPGRDHREGYNAGRGDKGDGDNHGPTAPEDGEEVDEGDFIVLGFLTM